MLYKKIENSSNVKELAYLPDGRLIVGFLKGTFYAYEGATEETYYQAINSPSVGGYVSSNVKPRHKAVQVRNIDGEPL